MAFKTRVTVETPSNATAALSHKDPEKWSWSAWTRPPIPIPAIQGTTKRSTNTAVRSQNTRPGCPRTRRAIVLLWPLLEDDPPPPTPMTAPWPLPLLTSKKTCAVAEELASGPASGSLARGEKPPEEGEPPPLELIFGGGGVRVAYNEMAGGWRGGSDPRLRFKIIRCVII